VAEQPETRYAETADGVHIAYQTVGQGGHDLVLVEGFVSNVEMAWEDPSTARFYERLASFTRLILFDKRGVGLSDRVTGVATLEERMDDLRAVLDAVGSREASLMGLSEGAPMSILFAATYPQRTRALVLYGGMPRSTWAPDYPWAPPADGLVEAAAELMAPDIFTGADIEIWAPSLADDEQARRRLLAASRSSSPVTACSPPSTVQGAPSTAHALFAMALADWAWGSGRGCTLARSSGAVTTSEGSRFTPPSEWRPWLNRMRCSSPARSSTLSPAPACSSKTEASTA
jgi:pimeloyl-ACP methyl ester carboxylesterase